MGKVAYQLKNTPQITGSGPNILIAFPKALGCQLKWGVRLGVNKIGGGKISLPEPLAACYPQDNEEIRCTPTRMLLSLLTAAA